MDYWNAGPDVDDTDESYYRPKGCECPDPFVRHDPPCTGRKSVK